MAEEFGPTRSLPSHMRSTFLRRFTMKLTRSFSDTRRGTPTLADETLKRASPEANEWAGVRALSRSKRVELTQTLSAHQVKLPAEYAQVTNETYKALLSKTAKELKEDRGLKKTANLRDAMPTGELVYLMASEQLAKERIEDEDSRELASAQ